MEKREQNTSVMSSDNGKESLRAVALNLQQAIRTGTEDAYEAVGFEVARRPGLLGVMFPGKVLKENEEITVQNMRDIYKTRQDLLKAWVNIQLELTRNEGQMMIKSKLQQYEGELSRQAMQIRTGLTEFSQQKIAEMMDTFDRSTATFAGRIDNQAKLAENYKDNPSLYSKMKENLEKETEMFFATISELLDGFKEDLNNKLIRN